MKHVTKRLLAVALALVLCLSLLPGIALAADTYQKVTSINDILSGGQFVIVADGLALGNALGKKIDGVAVTPNGDSLSGSSLPVWTVEPVEGGIALSVNGQYLAYGTSGTDFLTADEAYAWSVAVGDTGFIITSAAVPNRGIAMQIERSRFGAYATSNISKPAEYVFNLDLYKLSDGSACAHEYTSEVTTPLTCTQDGVETFTCTKCGDSYTKTTTAAGHNYVDGACTKCDAVIETDPAKIIPEAYALAEGATLGYDSTLTGTVTEIAEPYSEQYKNITVIIVVEGYEDQPIKCYRLKGTGADTLEVGDVITVTGMIKNYKGEVEFDSGCKLDKIAGGENPSDMTPAEILDAAYALEKDTALEGTYTLTGEIIAIDTPYSSEYCNITVTIIVEGRSVKCFRLQGEHAEELKPTDIITVTGTLSNFRGTVQFDAGCSLDNWIPGEGPEIVVPSDPKEIVDAAYELAPGAMLPYEATLTGTVTEIVDPYSQEWGNITVNLVIDGRENKPILCYRMKGEGADILAVGDRITVTGNLKNYTKTDSETGEVTNTIEFTPCTFVFAEEDIPADGATISGTVTAAGEGETTIELLAGEEVVATVTASGSYSIENVAAGTYTLKVSKEKFVTREYTVTVSSASLTQDVKIHMIGDVTGDGKVNMGDVGKLNSHIKGTSVLTDEYVLLVANINGGSLNMGDTGALYAHVRGTKVLY
jgi:DNA/RNA endonuclease YhcR with UshA esterase domain